MHGRQCIARAQEAVHTGSAQAVHRQCIASAGAVHMRAHSSSRRAHFSSESAPSLPSRRSQNSWLPGTQKTTPNLRRSCDIAASKTPRLSATSPDEGSVELGPGLGYGSGSGSGPGSKARARAKTRARAGVRALEARAGNDQHIVAVAVAQLLAPLHVLAVLRVHVAHSVDVA